MSDEGINLLNLHTGDYFRTMLTDRVGRLVEKQHYCLRVAWNDRKGPEHVHRELVVIPHPRPLRVDARTFSELGPGGSSGEA